MLKMKTGIQSDQRLDSVLVPGTASPRTYAVTPRTSSSSSARPAGRPPAMDLGGQTALCPEFGGLSPWPKLDQVQERWAWRF